MIEYLPSKITLTVHSSPNGFFSEKITHYIYIIYIDMYIYKTHTHIHIYRNGFL